MVSSKPPALSSAMAAVYWSPGSGHTKAQVFR
jgi:hypothetical protein